MDGPLGSPEDFTFTMHDIQEFNDFSVTIKISSVL